MGRLLAGAHSFYLLTSDPPKSKYLRADFSVPSVNVGCETNPGAQLVLSPGAPPCRQTIPFGWHPMGHLTLGGAAYTAHVLGMKFS